MEAVGGRRTEEDDAPEAERANRGCLAWPPAAALREGGRVGVSGARRRSGGWKFGRRTKETRLGSSLFLGRWKKKGNGREGNVGRQV